ncbi:MAG: hypothetical protein ACREOQ_19675 [Gemmatimonadales bacterium]
MIRAFAHALRPTRLRGSIAALLVAVLGTACNSTDVTDPTTVTPASTTPATAATGSLASLSYSGIPFGPTQLFATPTSFQWGPAMFTGSHDFVSPSGLVTQLNTARQKGLRVVVAMTGGNPGDFLTSGKFDLNKWKNRMGQFNTSTIRNAVAAAVSDGTLMGNTLIDEPETVQWGGNITKATIDAMAVYGKSIFPTLPMGIGAGPPAYKWRATERYTKLDWVRYQYSWGVTQGNVAAWRDAVLAQARKDGVQPAFSLNLLNGGIKDLSGSWDCPQSGKGTYNNNCWMTPDQVKSYGRTLAAAGGCVLTMWRYDNAFISRSANQDAFRTVAAATSSATRRSCKRP